MQLFYEFDWWLQFFQLLSCFTSYCIREKGRKVSVVVLLGCVSLSKGSISGRWATYSKDVRDYLWVLTNEWSFFTNLMTLMITFDLLALVADSFKFQSSSSKLLSISIGTLILWVNVVSYDRCYIPKWFLLSIRCWYIVFVCEKYDYQSMISPHYNWMRLNCIYITSEREYLNFKHKLLIYCCSC